MMRYKFFNVVGTELAECEAADSREAVRWLFSSWQTPPPEEAIHFVSANGALERYSVGPFDVLVEKQA